MAMISGIQGQPLEVTVVGCNKLKDTEWISRQDPYVCLEYASTKFRTRTHTDGGKNPVFQEKFTFTLIEGLREINVVVYNSNTVTFDDFIGSGKIQINKVLSQGYDDAAWPLQTKTGRYAGEVRLIMHYANANRPATGYGPTALPYGAPPPQTSHYSVPPPQAYPPSPYSAYPPQSVAYPPSPYPPPQPSAYPPSYPPPAGYPSSTYPPPSVYPPSSYPPPSQDYSYPPGPYPGTYPPRPY